MSEKIKYKVQNWSDYNKSLIQRGDITLWISDDIEEQWLFKGVAVAKGRPKVYTDFAIETCLTLRYLFKLPLRATQGFVNSLMRLAKMDIQSPDYSRLSRRAEMLPIKTRCKKNDGPIDIVWDSTGVKIYGEGEWKVKKHGVGKRRTWRKLHLGCDPLSHEIVAFELTGNDVTDEEAFPSMFDSVEEEVNYNYGDGAYDRKKCYDSCYKKGSTLVTPPRRDAKKSSGTDPTKAARDRAIERIEQLGNTEEARKKWKEESDYHTRSLAETAMFRFKTICGDKLKSRVMRNQKTEVAVKVKVLNKITTLGMPDSYPC